MTELKVYFRGLFALVRHTDPPPRGGRIPAGAEHMTIVFPQDDSAGHAHGGSGHAHAHQPVVFFDRNAVPGMDPKALDALGFQDLGGGQGKIELENETLFLPVAGSRKSVQHADDEVVKDDGSDVSCDAVGASPDRWRSLSRLGNLNELTGAHFDVPLNDPDPRLQASVRLSGGRIRCIRSYKALADCFFEYYTDKRTLAVQPGVEEIEYAVEAESDGFVSIGFGPLGATTPAGKPMRYDASKPLVIECLPPKDAPLAVDLNHFQNYYKLMTSRVEGTMDKRRQPLIRVAARCHENQIVLTMAGDDGINREFLKDYEGPISRTTPGQCTCLAAMVFAPRP